LPLQIQPELCAIAEVTAEPNGGVGGDRSTAIEDVSDPARGNADVERKPIGAQLAGCQFALQITLAKLETDSLAVIHRHCWNITRTSSIFPPRLRNLIHRKSGCEIAAMVVRGIFAGARP
jgi:hypothetical protein